MGTTRQISHLNCEIDAVYHEAAAKLGLSESAMWILYALCLNGGTCPLGEIICMAAISKQTVNSALRKLEREGMVYLESAGGRKKMVRLTAQGTELARGTAMWVLQAEDEIFASWSQEELDAYIALTEKYLAAFREKVGGLTV